MDQTRSIDRTKPIEQQVYNFLHQRFEVTGVVVGGEEQVYKKAALGIVSLCSDFFARNPDKLKLFVEE